MAARIQLLGMAARDPRLVRVRPNGMNDVAEYYIDVNWDKAGALGIPINSIHTTISAAFGSAYVNDFIQAGRVKKVFAQVDAPYRMLPQDLEKLYVRNTMGKMVPFSSFATGRWAMGSPKLERFNAFPSINIWGEPAPGHSTGEAMAAMEELIGKLQPGIGWDWTRGCIALRNADVNELFQVVSVGTPIVIISGLPGEDRNRGNSLLSSLSNEHTHKSLD
jgi:HAE1 family hydrophobic/amphiphilic exporter-1